jgi:uncharacterized protein (DUF169 family)
MEWQAYAKTLKELLELNGSPVAVTYTMESTLKADKGKNRACRALIDAREGKAVELSADNQTCGGGNYYLGLKPLPEGDADKALKDFLVNGEKLYCSVATFHRTKLLISPPPTGLAPYVLFAPLEQAELKPDIVVFICNPKQGCRLLTLDGYETGIPPKIQMLGATCHQVIGYPVISGELNVSLMDYTSRKIKDFSDNDLIVSIPYHRMHQIIRSIPGCTAGTAKFEVPEAFKAFISREQLSD